MTLVHAVSFAGADTEARVAALAAQGVPAKVLELLCAEEALLRRQPGVTVNAMACMKAVLSSSAVREEMGADGRGATMAQRAAALAVEVAGADATANLLQTQAMDFEALLARLKIG